MKDTIEIIEEFERKIAEYAGSKYGVATSSGTNAFFLSLLYLKDIDILKEGSTLTLPSRTYLSMAMSIKNAGLNIEFDDIKWNGIYNILPTNIYDCTVRFKRGMYIPNTIFILSFQYRKHIPIGRGGMILTDDEDMVKWLKMARFQGKHVGISRFKDKFEIIGWDMYMTPEQATRGLLIFNDIPDDNPDKGSYLDYPDLSEQEIFK